MKHSANFVILVLVTMFLGVAGVFVTSEALAANPQLQITHSTRVWFGEGDKVDFNAKEYKEPHGVIYTNITGVENSNQVGELTLNFKSPVSVDLGEDGWGDETITETQRTFDLEPDGDHYKPRYSKEYGLDLVDAEDVLMFWRRVLSVSKFRKGGQGHQVLGIFQTK
jgi:hypothetical protein